jgi:PGF-pre-PGF domain-containing protein
VLGNPNVTLTLNLAELPGTDAVITNTLSSDPADPAQSSFTLAAAGTGNQIVATAYTVNFTKTGIQNAGSGGIISNATITMTVSPAWVAAYGGTSQVVILHRADDGTTSVLTTTFIGTDTAGNYIFSAFSPTGLSTFVLASVSPLPPADTGFSSSTDSGGGGGGDVVITGSRASTLTTTLAGAKLGETATLAFNQPLSSGVPVAVREIRIVPARTLGSTQVIVRDTRASDVLEVTGRPVAGIEEIQLVGTNPASIDHAEIVFAVKSAWLRDHVLTPADVVVLRNHNNQWAELPTRFDHQDGDTYYFTATTPGFSYFAVAGKLPPVPAATLAGTPAITGTPRPAEVSTLKAVAAKPAEPSPIPANTVTAAAPDQMSSPAFPLPAIVVAVAGIVIAAVGILVGKRWWIRRQNPALFEDEPFFRFR